MTSDQTDAAHAKKPRYSWVLKAVAGCVVFVAWIWTIGFAYCLDNYIPPTFAKSLSMLIALAIPIAALKFHARSRTIAAYVGIIFLVCFVIYKLMPASHDRQWDATQARLPSTSYLVSKSEFIDIKNIRSFRYGPTDPKQNFYDDSYDTRKLKRVWFGVDRFTDFEPLAHTFISFEFEPGNHRSNFLAFSVETRREIDETSYSPIRGLFNNYETIYVIADEQDVLSVRSDVREHVVQLYPIKTQPNQALRMFRDMLRRANNIKESPEFYNTVTNNCTNNIVYHTNHVLEDPISVLQRGVIFPGYSDWLAYEKGLIDTELSLEEARERFRIDQRVKAYDGSEDFSTFIRKSE